MVERGLCALGVGAGPLSNRLEPSDALFQAFRPGASRSATPDSMASKSRLSRWSVSVRATGQPRARHPSPGRLRASRHCSRRPARHRAHPRQGEQRCPDCASNVRASGKAPPAPIPARQARGRCFAGSAVASLPIAATAASRADRLGGQHGISDHLQALLILAVPVLPAVKLKLARHAYANDTARGWVIPREVGRLRTKSDVDHSHMTKLCNSTGPSSVCATRNQGYRWIVIHSLGLSGDGLAS